MDKNSINAITFVVIVILFLMVRSCGKTNNTSNDYTLPQDKNSTSSNTNINKKSLIEGNVIDYKILYTSSDMRKGATTYYLLVNNIDISNDLFKKDMENIILDMCNKYGRKINITVFDNKVAADIYNKKWIAKIDESPLSEEEQKIFEKHYIMHFIGDADLKIHDYLNTIRYFDYSSPDNALVGKYVETKEFIFN